MALFDRNGEPLSNVDAAWLWMEDPTNLMTITAVMSFYEPLDFARLKALLEDHLLPFDRFRQRVEQPSLPFVKPRWVDDDRFNLHSHLLRVALPDPGGQRELQDMVSTLMSTPLDFSKPLWQFQYIENYRGGSAVVARLHHCIADGIALVRLLLSMTDDTARTSDRRRRPRTRPLGSGYWLPEVVNEALYSVRKLGGEVVERGMDALRRPEIAVSALRQGASAAGVLGNLLAMPADPPTVFRGELGTAKRCAWSDIMPLDQVKALGKKVGATVNDVLLTGVTGALRRYIELRGGHAGGIDIRAVVPVNLRPDSAVGELGNRFGLVFLALPVGLADRNARLAALKQRMDALKTSSEAVVTYAALNAVGMASAEVESRIVHLLGNKATAVMTNVPGPRDEIYFVGKRMRSMMFWVPQSARLGLGVSILSYAGQVRLGVATDAGLVYDPETIVRAFHEEMRVLLSELN